MTNYTGFKTLEVNDELVTKLHENFFINIPDRRHNTFPNLYVELKSSTNPKHTALGRVDKLGERIEKIQEQTVGGIKPRNREQVFAIDALMNPDIPVVCLYGSAGTGKSYCALAVALELMQARKFTKTVITRPMSEVGKYKLGTLPGDVDQKFSPYLANYMTNFEQFVNGNARAAEDLVSQHRFESIPIQLFRGASFNKRLVIVDEVQVLGTSEMLTIGTRIGEASKLVILGDLNQRDENIAKEKTGIYKLVNDKKMKQSPLTAVVELRKCERSDTAKLFSEVFEE